MHDPKLLTYGHICILLPDNKPALSKLKIMNTKFLFAESLGRLSAEGRQHRGVCITRAQNVTVFCANSASAI